MGKNLIIVVIIVVIFVVVLAVGYFAYAKTIKPKIEAEKETQKKQDEAIVIEQRKEELKDSLTEAQKQDAYALANRIFEDMKGWNKHDMLLYKKLFESSKAYFYYFVTSAYPSFDTSKSFVDRIKLQNFRVVNYDSRKANLNNDNAEALIAKIKNRIDEFTI